MGCCASLVTSTAIGSRVLRTPTLSAFGHVIALRRPVLNQIPFLRSSGRLTHGAIMDMDMRSAMRNGLIHRHVPLKRLLQIASLDDVNGNPITALNLFGINRIAWQGPENSVNGMNLVLILVAGPPTPTDQRRRRALRVWMMAGGSRTPIKDNVLVERMGQQEAL